MYSSPFQLAAPVLCILILITTGITNVTAHKTILRPVTVHEYDTSLERRHLHARAFDNLDLQGQGQLKFAGNREDGGLIFANMTLYAPNGMLMVLLEDFDHLTSSVDCQGDDGTMSLTFKSDQAYQYALQAWGFINAKTDDRFLAIANHQGCGPDEERQPYIINSVKEDSTTRTTYLAAEPAPWSDIAGSYELDYRHLVTHPHSLQRRGKIHDFWEHLKGNWDKYPDGDFTANFGERDKVVNLWHDDQRLILDCLNCFVTGGFHVMGHIKTHHWHLEVATLSFSPKGFNATMELQAAITYPEKVEDLSAKKELFSYPVPDLGFEIKHLLDVGVTLHYQIGFSTKLMGSTTVVFGATSSLPDDAVIEIDVLDRDKVQHRGFEGAALEPIFDVSALSASVKFAVFTQADIAFGIDIKHTDEKADVELSLKIPQLATTILAGYKEGGFCSQEDDAIETGAKVTTALSVELWFDALFGKGKHALYSRKLWDWTKKLDEHCVPVDIKGFLEGPPESSDPGLMPLSAVPTMSMGA